MSQVFTLPITEGPDTHSSRWMVVIFNDDHTPQELVLFTLMLATGCGREEANMEMWEAENLGKAPVHFAGEEECTAVAEVISRAGIKVEVCAEWND